MNSLTFLNIAIHVWNKTFNCLLTFKKGFKILQCKVSSILEQQWQISNIEILINNKKTKTKKTTTSTSSSTTTTQHNNYNNNNYNKNNNIKKHQKLTSRKAWVRHTWRWTWGPTRPWCRRGSGWRRTRQTCPSSHCFLEKIFFCNIANGAERFTDLGKLYLLMVVQF